MMRAGLDLNLINVSKQIIECEKLGSLKTAKTTLNNEILSLQMLVSS